MTTKSLYDELGTLRRYVDETTQSTEYLVDPLGRVEKIRYPDGTTEEARYENETGMVVARRDRAKQWILLKYENEGARLSRNISPAAATNRPCRRRRRR